MFNDAAPPLKPGDWNDIRLVVFDVDGTLYCQRSLRAKMLRELLIHTIVNCDLNAVAVLRRYRRIRERLGNEEVADFEQVLIAETASTTGNSIEAVGAIVSEWIDQKPLLFVAGCMYPGLPQLFAELRRSGKIIGVLSDYPAKKKLEAMNLDVDCIVCAGDPEVGVLKPHPRGLETLMARAGIKSRATILIGDRPERDGLAAQRAGVRALIRSEKAIEGWQTFPRFDDPIFAPLLTLQLGCPYSPSR